MLVKHISESFGILALYIYDTIVMNKKLSLLNSFRSKLVVEFDLMDHGEIHFCLEIQVRGLSN